MIAEIVSEAYDALGKKTYRPDLRRKAIHPTFPMGRYVSHPLTAKCESIRDICKFLSQCTWVSDKKQFGKDDYWQPPEDFEQTKQGDCDDFALWTWRQFLALGYDARFVAGRGRRYGEGHAWVEFFKDGKCFLVEPQAGVLGDKIPRLITLRYHPKMSVAWDGDKISFYLHEDRKYNPRFVQIVPLVAEWLSFWARLWLKTLPRLPIVLYRISRKLLTRNRKPKTI